MRIDDDFADRIEEALSRLAEKTEDIEDEALLEEFQIKRAVR